MLERLFIGSVDTRAVAIALVATFLVAWFAARAVRRMATAGLRSLLQDSVAVSSPLVRGPLRLFGLAAFVLIFLILLFPAFQLAGLQPRTGVHLGGLGAWAFGSGLRVLFIVLVGYAVVRTVGLLVARFEHEMTVGTDLEALERAKRARTLGSVVSNATVALVIGVGVLMVLLEFGVNITPVLTGAGIVGLAVGFGAQTLVRDIISGFFMILENQVRVGDVAAINGTGGMVEAINLRTIVLRDQQGTVHVFPNGGISTLANLTKDFSYYVIDIGISYDEDPDRVAAVLRETGASMQEDLAFSPSILEPIEILGVDGFGDSSVIMKVRIKTVPLKQWEVGRELRKRIKKAFDAHGIEIPFPQRVVTHRGDPRNGAEVVGD